MQPMILRPTERADLERMGGKELPFRVRALTAVIDGEVAGFGGLGYQTDGTVIAFVNMNDDVRRRKIQLHKTALAVFKEARERGVKMILANADPKQPAAVRWLERLGFKLLGNTWVWHA